MATRQQYLERIFDDTFRYLRYQGLVREVRQFYDTATDGIRLDVRLPHNEMLRFSFSGHELQMGGEAAVRYFCDRVSHDCRRYCERAGWPDYGHYRHRNPRWMGFDRGARDEWATIDPRMWLGEFAADYGLPNEKAETKSRDLFIIGAGQKAFDIIDAGKGLPITGSKGTKYTLHKRAAYCIERHKDGAKLCAVVPGVPLYDHLLGIKIMVENDEPKFLSIANVSPGISMRQTAGYW